MVLYTKFEKNIIKEIHNIEVFTNIVYLIPSLLAISLKKWFLGVFGLIVFITSLLHHLNNCLDFENKKSIYKENKIIYKIDIILSSFLALYGLYTIYINSKIKPLSYTFISLLIIFSLLALYALFTSISYKKKAIVQISNSELFRSNEVLYELYHSYWHICSGICFILTILWLSF